MSRALSDEHACRKGRYWPLAILIIVYGLGLLLFPPETHADR